MRIRYSCSVCGKEFSDKDECLEHEKSHTFELDNDSLCEGELYTSSHDAQGIDLPALLYVPVTHYLENTSDEEAKKSELVYGAYSFVRVFTALEMKQLLKEKEAQ